MGNLKASVFIASPCYGGLNHVFYTMGLLKSAQVFANNGILMYYGFTQNESLITRGRNRLVHDFLATECTHLMFIDADIGFEPEDIVKMIDADKEIICGLYPKKEIDWPRVKEAVMHGVPASELHQHTGSFVVNFADGAKVVETKLNEPFEIENGGTGFMLIKREVFDKLDVPEYLNDMQTAVEFDAGVKQDMIKEFFTTSIDDESGGRLLSEDYHFCKIARKKGIKVWAAPWAQLVHCGTYNFHGSVLRQY
jgi:hypothetical protein